MSILGRNRADVRLDDATLKLVAGPGPGGYRGYLRTEILGAAQWIPSTEWGLATSLRAQNDPREPVYESSEGPFAGVFDYADPIEGLPAR